MPVARCIANERLELLDMDDSFAEFMHEPVTALRGRSALDLTHPDDRRLNKELLERLKQQGEAFAIKKRYCRKDGSIFWVENHVSLFDAKANAITLLATIQMEESHKPLSRELLLKIACRVIQERKHLLRSFGQEICAEPAFDILLDLFIHQVDRRPVPVMDACLAAGRSNTAALRHIAMLVERGLVARKEDGYDRRRTNLALTPLGFDQIEIYLTLCAQR